MTTYSIELTVTFAMLSSCSQVKFHPNCFHSSNVDLMMQEVKNGSEICLAHLCSERFFGKWGWKVVENHDCYWGKCRLWQRNGILFAKYFDLYVTLSRQTRQCRWLFFYHVCLNRWACLISLFMAHLKDSCVWGHCGDLFNLLGTVKWRMGVCHYCMWPSATMLLVVSRTCHTWEIAAVEQLMIKWFHFSARCLTKLSLQKSSKDL